MKSAVIPNNDLPVSYPRYKFNISVTDGANPGVLDDPNGLAWSGGEKAKCNGKFLAMMNWSVLLLLIFNVKHDNISSWFVTYGFHFHA